MKRMILLAILAVALPALAQQPAQKEPAKPAAEAPKPAAEPAKPQAKKRAAVAGKNRRHEDARHCLERPNNEEIIKCAEAYL